MDVSSTVARGCMLLKGDPATGFQQHLPSCASKWAFTQLAIVNPMKGKRTRRVRDIINETFKVSASLCSTGVESSPCLPSVNL